MSAHDEILADRLNAEPAIFKGCSSSELGVLVAVAAVLATLYVREHFQGVAPRDVLTIRVVVLATVHGYAV